MFEKQMTKRHIYIRNVMERSDSNNSFSSNWMWFEELAHFYLCHITKVGVAREVWKSSKTSVYHLLVLVLVLLLMFFFIYFLEWFRFSWSIQSDLIHFIRYSLWANEDRKHRIGVSCFAFLSGEHSTEHFVQAYGIIPDNIQQLIKWLRYVWFIWWFASLLVRFVCQTVNS